MKYLSSFFISAATVSALSVTKNPNSNSQEVIGLDEPVAQPPTKVLVETSPGQAIWIDEEEKWALRRVR